MKRGFTKIELLFVIAIIAVLAAILFPVFAKAREKARQSSCFANLLNMGMALRLYAQDHDGLFPPRTNWLSPLYPRYIALPQVFTCPSGQDGMMGEQKQPSLGNATLGGVGGPGAPSVTPPGPVGPPAPPPPPPPATSWAPPGPVRTVFAQGGPPGTPSTAPDYTAGLIPCSYYYHGGLRYNVGPLTALIADSSPRHNDRANTLLSDGSLKSVVPGQWYEAWWPVMPHREPLAAESRGPRSKGGGGDE